MRSTGRGTTTAEPRRLSGPPDDGYEKSQDAESPDGDREAAEDYDNKAKRRGRVARKKRRRADPQTDQRGGLPGPEKREQFAPFRPIAAVRAGEWCD